MPYPTRLSAVAVNGGSSLPSGTRAQWSVQPGRGEQPASTGHSRAEWEATRHCWVGGRQKERIGLAGRGGGSSRPMQPQAHPGTQQPQQRRTAPHPATLTHTAEWQSSGKGAAGMASNGSSPVSPPPHQQAAAPNSSRPGRGASKQVSRVGRGLAAQCSALPARAGCRHVAMPAAQPSKAGAPRLAGRPVRRGHAGVWKAHPTNGTAGIESQLAASRADPLPQPPSLLGEGAGQAVTTHRSSGPTANTQGSTASQAGSCWGAEGPPG